MRCFSLALLFLAACTPAEDCPDGQEFDDGACEPIDDTTTTPTGPGTGTGGATGTGTGSGTGTGTGTGSTPPPLTVGMSWQWQLTDQLDLSHDVALWDVDLFDPPDNDLQAIRSGGGVLICYFSAGSYEGWRPDAGDFPPAAVGNTLDGWPDERWVDIRDAGVRTVMTDRLDLALSRGCHGVEPDNVTAFNNDTGFAISPADQLDFNRFLADEAHARGLLIALKNDLDQVDQLVDWFDFAVNEECHDWNECDVLQPFLDQGKPVFNAEYVDDLADAPAKAAQVCGTPGLSTIVKDWDLGPALTVCP